MIESFRDSIWAAGIPVRGQIVADGRPHRYYADGDRKGTLNVKATLYLDGRPGGWYRCFKRGIYGTWSLSGTKTFAREERAEFAARMKAARKERSEQERRKREFAAVRAKAMWDGARETCEHSYLTSKGVAISGLRVGEWVEEFGFDPHSGEVREIRVANALLVPINNSDGKMTSLQGIFDNNENAFHRGKTFLTGSETRGGFFTIGGRTEINGKLVIIIAEGLATAGSIHAATGYGVVVAFSAGNLASVAALVRKRQPDAKIIICADSDLWTLKPIQNPGVTLAKYAAEKVGGVVAVPIFQNTNAGQDGKRPTDFNDLQAREGLDAVKTQVLAAKLPSEIVVHVVRDEKIGPEPTTEQNSPEKREHYSISLDAEIPQDQPLNINQFHAHMPSHRYIFAPAGDFWPASSVNARLPKVTGEDGKPINPSAWLDQNRHVEQMTWAPGEAPLIHG
ncbi:MAG TPA: toprim domain-containing protein, partial [Micropepsaceae bacterium]|nr:toprim domain-containing protein [Micropepsaceae bacterium]